MDYDQMLEAPYMVTYKEHDESDCIEFLYANYDEFVDYLDINDTDVLDLLKHIGLQGVVKDSSDKTSSVLTSFYAEFDIDEYFTEN